LSVFPNTPILEAVKIYHTKKSNALVQGPKNLNLNNSLTHVSPTNLHITAITPRSILRVKHWPGFNHYKLRQRYGWCLLPKVVCFQSFKCFSFQFICVLSNLSKKSITKNGWQHPEDELPSWWDQRPSSG
jgi:hypothetical protein